MVTNYFEAFSQMSKLTAFTLRSGNGMHYRFGNAHIKRGTNASTSCEKLM